MPIYIIYLFQQTQAEWQKVFYLSAAITSFGGLFYLIFASGELQPWAKDEQEAEMDEVKDTGVANGGDTKGAADGLLSKDKESTHL